MPCFVIGCSMEPEGKKDFNPFFTEVSQDGAMVFVSLFGLCVLNGTGIVIAN